MSLLGHSFDGVFALQNQKKFDEIRYLFHILSLQNQKKLSMMGRPPPLGVTLLSTLTEEKRR